MSNPVWLSKEFVERVLRHSKNDSSIRIVNIAVKPATNKGDNYTSDMHRATIEFTHNQNSKLVTEKLSIIIKVAPTLEGIHKELIEKAKLFDVEILMMTTALKAMEQLLPDTKLGGNCLYTQDKDPALLVIEDLAPLGFRMADRQAGLDLQHCILALRGLAKFHASSVAAYEKTPKYKELFVRGIFNTDNPPEMTRFFTAGMKTLANQVAKWPELGQKYSDKLMQLSDTGYDRASDSRRPDESEFNVINHGDFWVNNMLFKYDDKGRVVDHIFVDFQLSVYGSPAVDLSYFLNTSPSEEVLFKHKDNLLAEYLKVLVGTMKKLNCKAAPPSMQDLMEALRKREIYGLLSACTILPIVLIDKSEAQNLDEIMGQEDDTFNNKAYENEAYRCTMARRLPIWDAMGLLDL